MLPVKWTVLVGLMLKFRTIDWEPNRKVGIQLVCTKNRYPRYPSILYGQTLICSGILGWYNMLPYSNCIQPTMCQHLDREQYM